MALKFECIERVEPPNNGHIWASNLYCREVIPLSVVKMYCVHAQLVILQSLSTLSVTGGSTVSLQTK